MKTIDTTSPLKLILKAFAAIGGVLAIVGCVIIATDGDYGNVMVGLGLTVLVLNVCLLWGLPSCKRGEAACDTRTHDYITPLMGTPAATDQPVITQISSYPQPRRPSAAASSSSCGLTSDTLSWTHQYSDSDFLPPAPIRKSSNASQFTVRAPQRPVQSPSTYSASASPAGPLISDYIIDVPSPSSSYL
eukprot:TRINITY_DN1306_c0_g3_i1.p1 TRINITY_DN1306_c0_g3~~TRINITY_DN1306_c0_g3_i1.p1  ORF type:complete len:189 (+),score=29.11 TRINITY_DN1306_c0_g3_i1:222-788(+)